MSHHLEFKLSDLAFVSLNSLDSLGVTLEDQYLLLQVVVFLVQELYLVRQFSNRLLVSLMSVLN